MNSIKFSALIVGAMLFLGLGATSLSAKSEDVKKVEKAEKAMKCGASIIGINHRNLDTFEMDMELCDKLIPMIPNGKIIVAESGIYEHGQLKDLSKAGVDAFLVGESLMRTDNEEEALRVLKNG